MSRSYSGTSGAFPIPVQVDSLYYDGSLNKRWCAYLLSDEPSKRVLVRANGSPLWSAKGEYWTPPGPAIEIYPRHEWFNIFYGFSDDASLHRYYINIALPATLDNGSLSYVDLDLDIGVNDDFTYVMYDEDEFEHHSALWRYPAVVRERALATRDQFLQRIRRGEPLFDEWRRYWHLVPSAFVDGLDGARMPSIGQRPGLIGAADE